MKNESVSVSYVCMYCWSQVSITVCRFARTNLFRQFVVCWLCFRRGDSVTSKTRQRTKLSFESKRVMMHWVRSVLFCAWTVYWGCVFMLCIRMQLQLTHFVLRCLRCACLVEPVGCPCVWVFIHLIICCSVREALCFACVATLNINTPTSFIVNFVLLCFLVCGFSWLCQLTVCELQAGESCALKLRENWFSFVD
jgi:hypothetical protein